MPLQLGLYFNKVERLERFKVYMVSFLHVWQIMEKLEQSVHCFKNKNPTTLPKRDVIQDG